MVPDFAHVGLTAEIPLPNQGYPARFPARKQGYKSAAISQRVFKKLGGVPSGGA